jgi:hypothetical protein
MRNNTIIIQLLLSTILTSNKARITIAIIIIKSNVPLFQ